MQISADRAAEIHSLALQPAHLHRQHIRQRRSRITARPEAVEPTDHHQAFALLHARSYGFERRLPQRTGIDALQQNDVKRRRREHRTQIDGPAVLVPGIDERVIELDVGRGIDGPAEQPLFSEQIAVQVQHTQPSFQHGDEGAQLVIARDQLARLLGGAASTCTGRVPSV